MEQTSLGGHCVSDRQVQARHVSKMPGNRKDQGAKADFLEENPNLGLEEVDLSKFKVFKVANPKIKEHF